MCMQLDKKLAKFICLEGTDGSGKSSLRRYLTTKLWDKGYDAVSTGPHSWLLPRYTEILIDIRNEIATYSNDIITEAYAEDKKEHYERTIAPSIAINRWVIADRYIFSDIVYHSVLWGIDPMVTVKKQRELGVGLPDFVLFLNTPPDIAYARVCKRQEDGFKFWETEETLIKLYEKYKEVFFSNLIPDMPPIYQIDNSGNQDQALKQAHDIIMDLATDTISR